METFGTQLGRRMRSDQEYARSQGTQLDKRPLGHVKPTEGEREWTRRRRCASAAVTARLPPAPGGLFPALNTADAGFGDTLAGLVVNGHDSIAAA